MLDPALALKWPNDVVSPAGDKVAGLLAERTGDLVLMGFGANLYWPEPPAGFGALFEADPGPTAGQVIAADWAHQLLAAVGAGPGNWGRSEYRLCSATIGTTVSWDGGGPALAIDVEANGGLVVEAQGNRQVLRSGQVRSVRTTTLPD